MTSIEGKKKIYINLLVGVLSNLVILFLGFIVPRIILVNYGSDTNGITSTISQIFTYMALLESGISQASRNALYNPIKRDDKNQISFFVSLSRRYYRKISYIYFTIVIIIALFIPLLLKTNVDYSTIMLYTLFEGLTSVVSFYFINTWTCFLMSCGKNYVINSINLVTKILCYGIKIILAYQGLSIVYIQIGYFVISLIQLMIYYRYMKKHYSWINYSAAPASAKLPDRNSFVITEIAWTIFSSTDMIILSFFVSTSVSSVYSVYNMIFLAINNLLMSAYSALNYNLGLAYYESIEKYKIVHNIFHSMFLGAMTVLMCVTYVLTIPFISMYTGGVTDTNYIYESLPVLFCLVQLLSWSRYIAGNLSGIAGYAKQTSYISLVEACLNIILSIVLVNRYGIVGVLIATVVALPIKVIYCNWLAEKVILKRSPVKTIATIIANYVVFFVTVILFDLWNVSINNIREFIVMGIALVIAYTIIVFGINSVINKDLKLAFKFLRKGRT